MARKAGSKNGVRKVVPKDIPEKQVSTVDRGPPASFSDADEEYELKRPKKSKDGKINSIAGLIQRYHELAGK